MSSSSHNSEIEGIAAQLRAVIRKARRASALAPGIQSMDGAVRPEPQIDADIQILHSIYDVAGAPFTSHRRFLGRFIILVKNFARELLVQLLARQSIYNGAAVRVITHLNQRLNSLAQENARLAQRLAALESGMEAARTAAEQTPLPNGPRQSTVSELDQFNGVRLSTPAQTTADGHQRGARGRA